MANTKRMSSKRRPRVAPNPPQEKGGWLLKTLALVILLPAFLFGLIVLGQYAREQIEDRPRYKFPLSDIACTAPPGMSRGDFLSEVQYHAELPDQLNILAADLPQRLADAFRLHPWVEKVTRVNMDAAKQVRVECVFRTPVLAVPWGNTTRAVDREGVLLPPNAVTAGLPIYEGKAKPPAGPTGARWGDADVEAAARRAQK